MKFLHARNPKKKKNLPTRERDFSFLQNVHNVFEAYPTSYSVGTVRGLSVKLTAHLHLIPMLKMNGDIPAPPPHLSSWCV